MTGAKCKTGLIPKQIYCLCISAWVYMQALIRSLIASLLLFLLKIIVGITTQSFSIIAEALHSLIDILSISLGVWSVKTRRESLALIFEATILSLGIIWLCLELYNAPNYVVRHPLPGICVSLASAVTYVVTFRQNHKDHQHSDAVLANLYHLASDIGGSLLTCLGLTLVYVTGLSIFDKITTYAIVAWLTYLAGTLFVKITTKGTF